MGYAFSTHPGYSKAGRKDLDCWKGHLSTAGEIKKFTYILSSAILIVGIPLTKDRARKYVLLSMTAAMISVTIAHQGIQMIRIQKACKTVGIQAADSTALKSGTCKGFPTENCTDSVYWRNKLIEAAQHNIVISGNYCGGRAINDCLNRIAKRMNEVPELKVVMLASSSTMTKATTAKFRLMKTQYGDRFHFVETPNFWHIGPWAKKVGNHCKLTLIDNGKYFITGSSNLTDHYLGTGLDDQSPKDFITAKYQDGPQIVSKSILSNGDKSADSGLFSAMGAMDDRPETLIGRLIESRLARTFRDMDFVFKGDETVGPALYNEMLNLAYRWEALGQAGEFKLKISGKTSNIQSLIDEPREEWSQVNTAVDFGNQNVESGAFSLITLGPECEESCYETALVKQIEKATSQIVINHMYFHPTGKVMDALIAAANRGVLIKIISNSIHKKSPKCHENFVPRNRYNYGYLIDSVDETKRKNITVLEFAQSKKGLHKKVVVIDDTVIAGSSNFGYKSLETAADYELNFSITSKAFAKATLDVFKEDEKCCLVKTDFSLSINDYWTASYHRAGAFMWG